MNLGKAKTEGTYEVSSQQVSHLYGNDMSVKFPMTLGCAIRKRVINQIRLFCDLRGVDCDIREYKHWLSSDYTVRLSGDGKNISTLCDWLGSFSD